MKVLQRVLRIKSRLDKGCSRLQTIKALETLGYRLSLENGSIAYSYIGANEPTPEKIKPLLLDLKENKSEAVLFLKNRPLEEACKVNQVLKQKGLATIWSDTLKERVYFARDKEAASIAPKGAVVYSMDELRELQDCNKEELRELHERKKLGKVE